MKIKNPYSHEEHRKIFDQAIDLFKTGRQHISPGDLTYYFNVLEVDVRQIIRRANFDYSRAKSQYETEMKKLKDWNQANLLR